MKAHFVVLSLFLLVFSSERLLAVEFEILGRGRAYEVSDNGKVIAGIVAGPGLNDSRGWLWTREGGLSTLEPLRPNDRVFPNGITADGTIIVGRSGSFATIWSAADDYTPQGSIRGVFSNISADGTVIVGSDSSQRGFVSTATNEKELLLQVPRRGSGGPTGLSADGSVIAGVMPVPPEAIVWFRETEQTKALGLGMPDGQRTNARFVSRDGSIVVGEVGNGDASTYFPFGENNEPFRWTEETGLVPLGILPGTVGNTPTGISADASVIVGNSSSDNDLHFVWDELHGMRHLEAVLEDEHGTDDLSRHRSVIIRGMSADARTLIGNLNFCFGCEDEEAWALFLDRPLVVTTGVPGDFNGSADLDVGDLELFSAELRSNRNVDLFDVNDDADVDFQDWRFWVHDLAATYFGDANLDGQFNSIDLVHVLQASHYEDSMALNSTWSTGDWDGDGDFTRRDLILALADGGYPTGTVRTLAPIPEPSSIIMLLLAVATISVDLFRRRGWTLL